MTDARARAVLRVSAVVHVVVGVLLALATWDGLYDALELPQPLPAVIAQLGGIAVIALGYLLWTAGSSPTLRAPVARAAGATNLLWAVILVLWLTVRDQDDLGVGDAGIAALVVAAAVFATLGLATLVTGARRPGP